ncbi:MAG: hypothetical protein AB7O97_24335 [Planctomycetota bacterium]
MNRSAARASHLGWLSITASGAALAWTSYVAVDDDPFALQGNAWQPAATAAHLLAAPAFVFVLGWLWHAHVGPKLRAEAPHRRRSGLVLLALTAMATSSGYLLQVATDATARTVLAWTHGLSGAVACAVYALHLLLPRGGRNGDAAGATADGAP